MLQNPHQTGATSPQGPSTSLLLQKEVKGNDSTSADSSLNNLSHTPPVHHLVPSDYTTITTTMQTDKFPGVPVIAMDYFRKVETGDKLDLLMAAINKINTNFHYKFEALSKTLCQDMARHTRSVNAEVNKLQRLQRETKARVDDIESNLPNMIHTTQEIQKLNDQTHPTILALQRKIDLLESNQGRMNDDIAVLKGFSQAQEKHITENKKKITTLTARSMAQNIMIYGLTSDIGDEENCKELTLDFFHTKHIFNYTKNLKGIQNDVGDFYRVQMQLPEPFLTEKCERDDKMRGIKKANAAIPDEEKSK